MSLIHIPSSSGADQGRGGAKNNQLVARSRILAQPRYTLLAARSATETGEVMSTAISSDGLVIANATMDSRIFVWVSSSSSFFHHSSQNEEHQTPRHHHHHHPWTCVASYKTKAPATRIKFASSDALLVCALACGQVIVIDIEAGAVARSILPPRPETNNTKRGFENTVVINDLAVSSIKDTTLATCGDDGRVCIFDTRVSGVTAGATAKSNVLTTSAPLTAITFAKAAPSSAPIASAAAAGGMAAATAAAAPSSDEYLFCGGVDGCVRWLQRTGGDVKCVVECKDAHDDVICGIDSTAASSPGTVLSYSHSGSLRVHDLRPWSQQPDKDHVLFEADVSRSLASAEEASEATETTGILSVDRSLLRCCFSPTGVSIACGTVQGSIGIFSNWQQQQHDERRKRRVASGGAATSSSSSSSWFVAPHRAPVTDVCFHPHCDEVGEAIILSSSIDGTCVLASV